MKTNISLYPKKPEDVAKIPDGSLLLSLRQIGHEYAYRMSQWGIPVHVTGTLLDVYVDPENAEPSLLACSRAVKVPRQTMTFILDYLEKRKLVKRIPHPVDRRRKQIRLTPKGLVLAKKIYEDILGFESRALQVINSKQRPAIRAAIDCYIEALVAENAKLKKKNTKG